MGLVVAILILLLYVIAFRHCLLAVHGRMGLARATNFLVRAGIRCKRLLRGGVFARIIVLMAASKYASKLLGAHGICLASGIMQHQNAGLRQVMFLEMKARA